MRMCRKETEWLGIVIVACLLAFGCDRSADDSGTRPDEGSGEQTAGPDGSGVDSSLPTARDSDDDPERPRALPRTGELPGWVKTEPIRLLARDEYGGIRNDAGRTVSLSGNRLDKVAVCRYWDDGLIADVLVIEAVTPMDAYGAFALMTTRHGVRIAEDRSVRSINEATRTVTGWQGDTVVQIRFSGKDSDAARESGRQLFNRIVFNLLAVDPPLLLRLVPPERLGDVKVYVARSVATLKQSVEALRGVDASVLDRRLGLDGQRFVSLAVVRVAGEEGENLIWLVEYPDAESAANHYKRYRAALDDADLPLDGHTILSEPKGPYLMGSWAAELESIQNLLPSLRQALPEEVFEG